jgi:hypothetical protein
MRKAKHKTSWNKIENHLKSVGKLWFFCFNFRGGLRQISAELIEKLDRGRST